MLARGGRRRRKVSLGWWRRLLLSRIRQRSLSISHLLQRISCRRWRTSRALERERPQVIATRSRSIVFPIEGELLESVSPLVCFHFRVGHETIPHTRAEDLKSLFLVGDPTHVDNVVNVDESLDGVGSLGSCLFVLVVLEKTVALG